MKYGSAIGPKRPNREAQWMPGSERGPDDIVILTTCFFSPGREQFEILRFGLIAKASIFKDI